MKKGFKQTEVGLIPEDWSLFSFDDIFSFNSTSNYSKAEMSDDNEVGCIHYGLIHSIPNSQYNLENGIKYYVSKEQAKYEFVRDGDVIMVDASEDLEGLNKSVEIKGVGDNKFISGLHTYLLRDKKSLLVDNFRGLVLNSKIVKNQMLQLAVGMKVFGVSKSQIVNVKIPLPPTLAEQKAIATALSDVDDLISSLDALIAKKKAIKQGAMQQLLTPPSKGGKRLDGFDGEWAEKEVSDVFSSVTDNRGKTPPYSKEDDIELIETASISFVSQSPDYSKVTKYVNKETYENWFRQHPKEGDILISTVGEYSGNSAIMTSNRGTIAQNLIGFRPKNINPFFFFYWTRSDSYRTQLKKVMMGHAQPSLKVSWLIHFLIQFPIDSAEQKAIAQILSDMDKELEELATKKEKYEHIKQGMMQELLTGKTRLV